MMAFLGYLSEYAYARQSSWTRQQAQISGTLRLPGQVLHLAQW